MLIIDKILTFFKSIKRVYIYIALFLVCLFLIFYAFSVQKRFLNEAKKDVIALQEQTTILKELNSQNELVLQHLKDNIDTTIKELNTLHKIQKEKEVRYAVQQEKNQHSIDGNISPVIYDTFDFLRKQRAKEPCKNSTGKKCDTK